MKNKTKKTSAFTLIELLMVIAIIGILAGILIPTVGAVRKQANIAASKAQLSSYVNALQMFKGEYGYFPAFGVSVSGESYDVPLATKSSEFIRTLSGREINGNPISADAAKTLGNRRAQSFHSFSESEFLLDDDDTIDDSQLADRFNNTNIVVVIDANGNGLIDVPKTDGSSGDKTIKASVSAYVSAGADDAPAYYLYD